MGVSVEFKADFLKRLSIMHQLSGTYADALPVVITSTKVIEFVGEEMVVESQTRLQDGLGLADTLDSLNIFTPLFDAGLLKHGDFTGSLNTVLELMTEYYAWLAWGRRLDRMANEFAVLDFTYRSYIWLKSGLPYSLIKVLGAEKHLNHWWGSHPQEDTSSLHDALQETGNFDEFYLAAIDYGARTGNLTEAFGLLLNYYLQER